MSTKVYALGIDLRWHIVTRGYPGHADTACGQDKLRCSKFQTHDDVRPAQEVGDEFHPLCSGCWMARAKQNGASS